MTVLRRSSSLSENEVSGLPCPDSTASFWHSEPSVYLLNHQTTSTLPETADIVVIGSGITGASIARYLAEDERAEGMKVLMLEARQACWGATGRNGGHCQPLLIDRGPDVAEFERRNVEAMASYVSENDIACEWRTVTACRTFWDVKHMDDATAQVKQLKTSHPDLGKLISVITDKKSLLEHRVSPTATGALLTQGAGILWPYKYVAAILEKLIQQERLNLQTNTPVTKIEPGSESVVYTSRGAVRAKHVILATNGYTSHLLPSFRSFIAPVRCEMSALHPPQNSEHLPDSYGFVAAEGQSDEYDDYLIQRPFSESPGGKGPRRGGQLMFGGGRGDARYQCVGVSDDDVVDIGEASYLRRMLPILLELGGEADKDRGGVYTKELKASHQWTGIKGYSIDNMPWVGKVPEHESIWCCGGYTGHGMPNATLCGKAVVDMLLSTTSSKESYDNVCRRLVKSGDLPQAYVISPERVKQANQLPTVHQQDEEARKATAAAKRK